MKTNNEILTEIHQAKTHSLHSREVYSNAVKKYCNLHQMQLHELLLEADKEEEERIRWKDRKLKQRLLKFRQYLVENYSKNTIRTYFNAIRSIYIFFEIEVQNLPKLNQKNVYIPEPINYVDLPNKDIIKKSLQIADTRMKAIILFMSSSGCAKKETLNLTIQDFINATKMYHNEDNIYDVISALIDREDVVPMFRLNRQKTNKYYYTFCSPEAVNALIAYMLTFEKELKPNDRLFPIHEDYLSTLFINLNNTLKLGKKGLYNRMRSHMLRKFHASQLYNAGLTLDEIDALQGRGKDATHRSYFMEDPEKLRVRYIEKMDAVTINLDVNNIDIKSKEFVELEKELDEKNKTIAKYDELLQNLDRRLENLESQKDVPLSQEEFDDLFS